MSSPQGPCPSLGKTGPIEVPAPLLGAGVREGRGRPLVRQCESGL